MYIYISMRSDLTSKRVQDDFMQIAFDYVVQNYVYSAFKIAEALEKTIEKISFLQVYICFCVFIYK